MYYCVRCRKKTESIDKKLVKTANGKNRMRSKCAVCGTEKSSFVSSKNGKGFTDMLPVELHLYSEKGENVPGGTFNDQPKYSYCGPGTKFEQRTREGYKGINKLDEKCKLHDRFYTEYPDTKRRNVSDIALANVAERIANDPSTSDTVKKDAGLVSKLLSAKAVTGLGVKKKKNGRNN